MSVAVSPPIAITVEVDGDGWMWLIDSGYDGQPIVILSQPLDKVSDASDDMRKALEAFKRIVEGNWRDLSAEAKKEHLDGLKAKGRLLTGALFGGRQDEFAEHLARLASPIITQFSRGSSQQPLLEFAVLN